MKLYDLSLHDKIQGINASKKILPIAKWACWDIASRCGIQTSLTWDNCDNVNKENFAPIEFLPFFAPWHEGSSKLG